MKKIEFHLPLVFRISFNIHDLYITCHGMSQTEVLFNNHETTEPPFKLQNSWIRCLLSNFLHLHWFQMLCFVCWSSACDKERGVKVAIKKLARPFQSAIHAKRAYREIRLLKHMHHENVSVSLERVSLEHVSLERFWSISVNRMSYALQRVNC